MEDVQTAPNPPEPEGGPTVLLLRAMDAELAAVEDDVRRLRAAVALALDAQRAEAALAVPAAAPVLAPALSPAGPLSRIAERAMLAVARASLAAQERVERELAERQARRDTSEQPAERPRAAQVLVAARETVARTPRAIGERVGGWRQQVTARLDGLAGRPAVLVAGRRALRVVGTATAAVVFAVQVLGIGRPSPVPDIAAGPEPVAPASAEPVIPVPAPPPPPPPEPQPAPVEQPTGRITAPVALRVPAIEVDAPVVIVELEADGETMEIPADVRTVGWYEPFPGGGVAPGERGTAVIAGHVDSRTQGRGAFWPLRELSPGDVIEGDHVDGSSTRWRVDEVVRYPKDDIPINDIFTFVGDERLALITCGGEFDRSTGSYLDNYVVFASPLPSLVDGSGQALPTLPVAP